MLGLSRKGDIYNNIVHSSLTQRAATSKPSKPEKWGFSQHMMHRQTQRQEGEIAYISNKPEE